MHSDVMVRTVVGVVTLNFSTMVGETSDVPNSDAIYFRLVMGIICSSRTVSRPELAFPGAFQAKFADGPRCRSETEKSSCVRRHGKPDAPVRLANRCALRSGTLHPTPVIGPPGWSPTSASKCSTRRSIYPRPKLRSLLKRGFQLCSV